MVRKGSLICPIIHPDAFYCVYRLTTLTYVYPTQVHSQPH